MSIQLFGGSAGPAVYTGTDQQTFPYSYDAGGEQLLSQTPSFVLGASKTALIIANIDALIPQNNGLHASFLDGASAIYPLNSGNGDLIFVVPNAANESAHFTVAAWVTLAAGSHQIKWEVNDALVVGANKIFSAQLIVVVF